MGAVCTILAVDTLGANDTRKTMPGLSTVPTHIATETCAATVALSTVITRPTKDTPSRIRL